MKARKTEFESQRKAMEDERNQALAEGQRSTIALKKRVDEA